MQTEMPAMAVVRSLTSHNVLSRLGEISLTLRFRILALTVLQSIDGNEIEVGGTVISSHCSLLTIFCCTQGSLRALIEPHHYHIKRLTH